MTTRRSLREAKTRRFRRVRAVLAGGLVLGVGGAATLASWTDQEFATTTITAGTFAIESRVNSGLFLASPQTEAILPFLATGLYPGEQRAAFIQFRNLGTVPGVVSLDSVVVLGANGSAPAGNSLSLQNNLKVGVSISLTGTVVEGEAPPCTTSTAPTASVVGIQNVPSLLAQSLPANRGGNVTYCFVVELPSTADNGTQGGDVRPTWTFNATTITP